MYCCQPTDKGELRDHVYQPNANQFTPARTRCAAVCKLAWWHLCRGGTPEPYMAAGAKARMGTETCLSTAGFAHTHCLAPSHLSLPAWRVNVYRCLGSRLTHMSRLAQRGTSLRRAGDPLLAGFRSRPHLTTASCTSQRLPCAGARSSPVLGLGAGSPGEAWMELCPLPGAERPELPARPEAAEMGGALPAAVER